MKTKPAFIHSARAADLRRLLCLSSIAAISSLTSHALPLVIDSFNLPPGGQLLVDSPGGGSAASAVVNLAILGGTRSAILTASGVGSPALLSLNLNPSALSLANPPQVSSVSVLTYDASGVGLGNIDLIGGGYDSLGFGLFSSDHVSSLKIDLFDGATVSSITIPLSVTAVPIPYSIPFASFTTAGVGNPFASLDKVVLTLDVPADGDLILTEFNFHDPVPENSPAFALLGLGAGCVIMIRRRVAA